MGATFKTNPIALKELLKECESGELQLPDFQRSWVWDDERIRSLLASISQAFPVGAIMTLENGGEVDFKPRQIEGTPTTAGERRPQFLLLDGQQRLTSLYQTVMRKDVTETITARRQKVKRFYYIDMRKALDPNVDRLEAIVGVPEDRVLRANFGKDVVLDVSSPEREFAALMYPVNRVLDTSWQYDFWRHWDGDKEMMGIFMRFQKEVLQSFDDYQIPVIALARNTTKEAVCLVFEKVNTGGKPLDAFELVTAMYAAENFELRKDWFAREARLKTPEFKMLANVANTEFLQAISLLHTRARRREAERAGVQPHELPAISATRQSLLGLPLAAYKAWADRVEAAYVAAAKFLFGLRIYRVWDLPYQSQLTPLVAIIAELGPKWDHEGAKQKVTQWYWCGVFGELYGSAAESRFARDMAEVPAWIDAGGDLPSTVATAIVRADRLRSMRSRVSAAYKGLNALLMKHGARDFRSGQDYDVASFFHETVDIHHIFPRDWCVKQGIEAAVFDSIINKTPLSAKTNRILGGVAPNAYLARLESGSNDAPAIVSANLDSYLASHLIEPATLRANDFNGFMAARQESLLRLIESATGREAYRGEAIDEVASDVEDDADVVAAAMAAE